MEEKVMLVDVSKCTACRGCQVACKQWNRLPAENTMQSGTYQNPPDLSWATWNMIRFTEVPTKDGGMKWLFRRDACLHCTDPACQRACPVPGCISKSDEGAVVINQNLCIGCKMCVNSCPFEVPRINPVTNKAYKCTLCWDRTSRGLIPACAKACAPGTLTFGNKADMIAQGLCPGQDPGRGRSPCTATSSWKGRTSCTFCRRRSGCTGDGDQSVHAPSL